MGKTLRKIIGTGLITGSLLGGVGCTANDLLLIGGGVLETAEKSSKSELDYDQRVTAGVAAGGLYSAYQANKNIEAAKEGKTEIYIDNSNNSRASNNASAVINDVWIEHDVYKNETLGMKIHTRFEVENRKDYPLKLIAYFYDEGGNKLRDRDGSYTTKKGYVSASCKVNPRFNSSEYKDKEIFIPDTQLEISEYGKHNLKVKVILWDKSESPDRKLAESDLKNFIYNKE